MGGDVACIPMISAAVCLPRHQLLADRISGRQRGHTSLCFPFLPTGNNKPEIFISADVTSFGRACDMPDVGPGRLRLHHLHSHLGISLGQKSFVHISSPSSIHSLRFCCKPAWHHLGLRCAPRRVTSSLWLFHQAWIDLPEEGDQYQPVLCAQFSIWSPLQTRERQ